MIILIQRTMINQRLDSRYHSENKGTCSDTTAFSTSQLIILPTTHQALLARILERGNPTRSHGPGLDRITIEEAALKLTKQNAHMLYVA